MKGTFQRPGKLTTRLERTLRRSQQLCAETNCSKKSGNDYRCKRCAAKYAARVRKFRALRARKVDA